MTNTTDITAETISYAVDSDLEPDVGLYWTAELYSFRFGSQMSGFPRAATKTVMPTHDLCHLLLGLGAAGDDFHWWPQGTDSQIRWSEAYCVALEMVLFWVYNVTINPALGGQDPINTILDEVSKHIEHFVDVHYKPFPCTSLEAWRSFTLDILPGRVRDLYPQYHKFRETEIRLMSTLDTAELSIEFNSRVPQEPRSESESSARDLATAVLWAMKRSRGPKIRREAETAIGQSSTSDIFTLT